MAKPLNKTEDTMAKQAKGTEGINKQKEKLSGKKLLLKVAVETSRMLLSATFLFSGFVKANDPLGTMYKLEDYAAAMLPVTLPDTFLLACGILLSTLEFMLGIYLLFAIKRAYTAKVTFLFMGIMTLLTVYIFIANPVPDCGCFGDAIVLSNGATLLKNVILMAAAVVVARHYRLQGQIAKASVKWFMSLCAMCAIIAYAVYCTICLPVIDFRPYKVGTDLMKAINTAEQEYEVKIIYKRGDETLELSAEDDDPDSTWTYVETRSTPVGEKHESVDLSIFDSNGDNVTEDILGSDGITFLLIIPNLRNADEGCVNKVNDIYDLAVKKGYAFFCLTASASPKDQAYWNDHTGAEYSYYTCDDRVLKTVVRGQPGLVMLKNGVIIRKWGNYKLPDEEELQKETYNKNKQ